jgi:hypothetical protein
VNRCCWPGYGRGAFSVTSDSAVNSAADLFGVAHETVGRPTEIAVGAPDFSFRRHIDGGYIVTQRGALDASLTLDHLLLGMRYLPQLRTQRDFLRIKLGGRFSAIWRWPVAGGWRQIAV